MLYDALRQFLTRAGAATENKRIFHPCEAQIPPALPESLPALPEHLAWPGLAPLGLALRGPLCPVLLLTS